MANFKLLNEKIEADDRSRLAKQIVMITLGNFIFAVTMNYLVTPFNIYCSGAMGVAQLIDLFFASVLNINSIAGVDLLGIIYWGMSIPVLLYGAKCLGMKFLIKTIYSITCMSVCISFLPVLDTPIIENKVMGCIAAAALGGIALGLGTFSSGAGAGAGDALGIVLADKIPGFSVGMMNMIINVCIYSICAFVYGIEGAVYSIFYAAVLSWAMDKYHLQNSYIEITIYSKVPVLAHELTMRIQRGVTSWYGEGAYTESQTNILKTIVTKKEVDSVVRQVKELDPDAFISINKLNKVHGLFDKHLSR